MLVAGIAAGAVGGGAGLGTAAGVLCAAGDVATKAAVGGGGRVGFIRVVFAAHGLAFVCLQFAFQRGGALATTGISTLLTNALPIAAGISIFGERLPGGIAGDLRLTAFVLVILCAVGLAGPDHPSPEGTMAACSALPSRISSLS